MPRGAIERFKKDYEAKWPKAVEKVTKDADAAARLLRLPRRALGASEDHQPDRVHFRHRPAQDEGHQGTGSRAAGLAMAYKLIESAQTRWRAVNAPELVALVRAGVVFERG